MGMGGEEGGLRVVGLWASRPRLTPRRCMEAVMLSSVHQVACLVVVSRSRWLRQLGDLLGGLHRGQLNQPAHRPDQRGDLDGGRTDLPSCPLPSTSAAGAPPWLPRAAYRPSHLVSSLAIWWRDAAVCQCCSTSQLGGVGHPAASDGLGLVAASRPCCCCWGPRHPSQLAGYGAGGMAPPT